MSRFLQLEPLESLKFAAWSSCLLRDHFDSLVDPYFHYRLAS